MACVDHSQLPDSVFHDLIGLLDMIEEQAEQVSPRKHTSEAEYIQDQVATIAERIENIRHVLNVIVGTERQHRFHNEPPAKANRPNGHGADA